MSISLRELDDKMSNIKAQDIKLNDNTDLETQNSEVISQLTTVNQQQGDLQVLNTNEKTNLVGAINEVFTSGNNVKSNTVDALLSIDTNLPITYDSSWNYIITQIGNISTGKKIAEGSFIVPSNGIYTKSDLNFSPRYIMFWMTNPNSDLQYLIGITSHNLEVGDNLSTNYQYAIAYFSYAKRTLTKNTKTVTSNGFSIYLVDNLSGRNIKYIAIE